MLGGATTCIASIREVKDKTSTDFTKKFYKELSKHISVGEALQRTKISLHNDATNINWANYILFGDPTKLLDYSQDNVVTKENK